MVEEQLVGFAPPSRRHVRMISQAIKSFGANRGGDSVVTFGVLMHDCLHAIPTVPTAIFQQSNFLIRAQDSILPTLHLIIVEMIKNMFVNYSFRVSVHRR
jgi:hypothetical protein